MTQSHSLWIPILVGLVVAQVQADDVSTCWPGFVASPPFHEQVRELRFANHSRAILVAPNWDRFSADRPTILVIYSTPNGNTAEQTLGCRITDGLDWHFDIQHVAAQVRRYREIHPTENVVLACLQAESLSWPTWRRKHAGSSQLIRQMVHAIAAQIPSEKVHIVLVGHSGGASFITGYVNSVEAIPSEIERIAYLDANYTYSDGERHGVKFLAWLRASEKNHLLVLAYDDRNIELNGKKVVGPTGGTFRASHRMLGFLQGKIPLKISNEGDFARYHGIQGRLRILIHPNPENEILHTRLVGEMNGLLYALTFGTPSEASWGTLENSRAYTNWVHSQPLEPENWIPAAPAIPRRRADAALGSEFAAAVRHANPAEREAAIRRALVEGNIPEFSREFSEVRATAVGSDGKEREMLYRVMPDYLAIGTDENFLRVPMRPATAQFVADAFGCLLPTRKMVDEIHRRATVKLAPQPLTENREAFASFFLHHQLIEEQRKSHGGEIGDLIAGIKKDVVVSGQIHDRPGHVAIYGWHYPQGEPIQPLTTVHSDQYVDYSHGVRLVGPVALVDGRPMRLEHILADQVLHTLLSDEGPIRDARYRPRINP